MSDYQFNPNEHLIQIKTKEGNKDYLPAQWRTVWFRAAYPNGSIETEMIHLDLVTEFSEPVYDSKSGKWEMKTAPGIAIFRAIVKDEKGGIGTGTKSEKGASFPDFIEKAETGAIGRALGALGYGTQFAGDEWDEAHRIVDSPVDQAAQQAEVTSVRADWGRTYNVVDTQIEERWPPFVAWVLGKAIADQDLKPYQIKKLRERIEEQKRASGKGDSPVPQAPAPIPTKLDPDIKKRLDSIYDKALTLGEFQKGKTKEESGVAFFALLTKILKTKILSAQHLDASRLDVVEKYLAEKETARPKAS